MIIVGVAGAVIWALLLCRVHTVLMRMYQLEEYDGRRLLRWAAHTREYRRHRAWLAAAAVAVVGAIAGIGFHDRAPVTDAWLISGALAVVLWRWPAEKKALVYTDRAKRMMRTARVTGVIVVAALSLDVLADPFQIAAVAAMIAMPLLAVAALVTANILLWPYELHSRGKFRDSAAQKIAAINPAVIAVAGSYGKTTTKGLIAHILDQGGDTLPTPKSFNTLLGLTKTINDDLSESHRTFVAEMDAYNPHEIATMCALVHPSVSVLASVGPAHLERFDSMDRIVAALLEVVEGTVGDGTAIVYAGGAHGEQVVAGARRTGRRVITYASEEDGVSADVVARGISVTGQGTSFRWCWDAKKIDREVTVALLGRHQALNGTAALLVAHSLERDMDEAVVRLRSVAPIEHRLQIIPTDNGVTVVDDSYNANPVGVHNALEVLEAMDVKRRIVVTPGIVELGDREYDENVRYGEHAARVCDDVILVRARTTPALVSGAKNGGLDDAHLHLVASLDEATAVIGRVASAGDVVLFANDLPDTY